MSPDNQLLAQALLKHEVERFFFEEAELLDDRKLDEWLELLTDDVRYWMPLVRNVHSKSPQTEFSRERVDVAWMDEGKETLTQRVKQMATGMHWAEEPRSRTSHLITNVMIIEADSSQSELRTSCRFLVYRNRLEVDSDIMVGKRRDFLRRENGRLRIWRREVYIDQNVLLSKNLTTFF